MLADSEPKEECCHSLNWVMAGKAKIKMGGVKQVSSPVLEWRMKSLPHQCEMLPTYQEERKLTIEEQLYTPQKGRRNNVNS